MKVICELHAPPALTPEKIPPEATGYEAAWAPELVWKMWEAYKSPATAGKRQPNPRSSTP
jgi:hypothetical protein